MSFTRGLTDGDHRDLQQTNCSSKKTTVKVKVWSGRQEGGQEEDRHQFRVHRFTGGIHSFAEIEEEMHDDVTTVTTCVNRGVSVAVITMHKPKKKKKNRKNKKQGRQHDAGDHLPGKLSLSSCKPNQVLFYNVVLEPACVRCQLPCAHPDPDHHDQRGGSNGHRRDETRQNHQPHHDHHNHHRSPPPPSQPPSPPPPPPPPPSPPPSPPPPQIPP
ncbi:hypothetical protein PPROV_000655600 [Pycnococcus provasolii]|uniref:Uncharacterized protein n=1 Tax=Pycnococcus provasolii TaxID=41880 RepID=A0A830HKW5_9CHLO|nr:hypothetical protein PPROV_000655600 [Pycnococcus provasolii]